MHSLRGPTSRVRDIGFWLVTVLFRVGAVDITQRSRPAHTLPRVDTTRVWGQPPVTNLVDMWDHSPLHLLGTQFRTLSWSQGSRKVWGVGGPWCSFSNPGGSLCYCTCAQEAISTKSAGRKWLVSGLKTIGTFLLQRVQREDNPRVGHRQVYTSHAAVRNLMPSPTPPPPLGGGLQGPALFSHDQTAGTVTICPCPCHCQCVTPKGGGGAPPMAVSRSNTSLPPNPHPISKLEPKLSHICKETSLWPLEPLSTTPRR